VYSWGRNSNFTLGHGDDKERNIPEVVDIFARMLHISIKQVLETKYHVVINPLNGSTLPLTSNNVCHLTK
jgi:alpha-tubulin suppressor-like RCC1 family protein